MKYLILATLILTACASSKFNRNPSSQIDYKKNMEILRAIPLVEGWEEEHPSEFSYAQSLIEIFNKIENEAKGRNLHRGTHARGSCFPAKAEFYSQEQLMEKFGYSASLADSLKRGIFNRSGEFDAELRFANAKGSWNADTVGDVRGLSFTIDTSNYLPAYSGLSRQDYMMNSSPMFAVNNIYEFYELMKAARVAGGDINYVLNPFYLGSTLKAKKLLEAYERNDTKSYALQEYWANLPYSHGINSSGKVDTIVKVKASPCDGLGTRAEPSEGKADDYLQKDIAQRAKEGNICFYVQLQFFNYEKLKKSLGGARKKWKAKDWIENGGEHWEEKVLPFFTVAKLSVPEGSKPLSCDSQYINTRLNSQIQNQPLGSIARIRTYVEENSRARRMGQIP